jgi:tRNA U34 2-thiouridine synthase MnmA/TrmU
MAKAILLLSGGLDSTLAGKMLLEQGVEVEAVNFTSPFCNCTPRSMGCSAARAAADQLGIAVRVFACKQDYLEIMKHPRFGRGGHMNACLDCRVHIFSKAKEVMEKEHADFVATGEVLGERPMSQRRQAMELIERESGLQGRIVRPLTAQLMPETEVEKRGIVDRSRLAAIRGRCRQPQFTLAAQLGLKDYLCPAGGCLLTDPEFAEKFKDLLDHEPDFNVADAVLLRYGRHFRLPSGTKIICGRDSTENPIIEQAWRPGDTLLVPVDVPGPSVLCRAVASTEDVQIAARILATYTKGGTAIRLAMRRPDLRTDEPLPALTPPLDKTQVALWHVGTREK